ncbi:MAG: hypothetical protein V2J42_10805 [Wenzhouxiangella sp.]|nr:hypothetical protein [Wenzhouxiangella sp.]
MSLKFVIGAGIGKTAAILDMKIRTFFLGLVPALVFSASAQALDFEFTDRESLSVDNDQPLLGRVVDLNGDFVFVGAPGENVPGGEGRVYVYRVGPTGLTSRSIISSQVESPREFGQAVASDGEWAAIGSRERVDLYRLNGSSWNFVRALEIPTPPSVEGLVFDSGFGGQLQMDGDRLIVADTSADAPDNSNVGAAAVFARNAGGSNAWGLEGVLRSPNADPSGFARGIALDGNLAIVAEGATQQVHVYSNSGSGWQFLRTLNPQQSEMGDSFGSCVIGNFFCLDVEGDYIAVGATNGNDSTSNSGSVHVFERNAGGANQFGQIAQIAPSQPSFVDAFGQAVQLSGQLLFVSAPGNSSNRVYVYSRGEDGFTEEQIIEPPASPSFGNVEFGSDIVYASGNLIIGAETWDDNPNEIGAVFSYYSRVLAECPSFDSIFCDRFER